MTSGNLARHVPAFCRQYAREVRRPILAPTVTPSPDRWPDHGVYAAWLGHSTVLLKINGFTILTDPVFSARAGIHVGPVTLGVKRLVAPALQAWQLPRVDLVLLSHAHMDHTDLPSLRKLESRHTVVVTAANTSDLVRPSRWARVRELRWGESERVRSATVKAVEVNHWGARMRNDHYRGYNGYLIEAGGFRVLFAGDTADTRAFRALRQRKPVHLAIMPIGAYNPWLRYHCTPEQAWRMAGEAGSEYILPVHHLTFPLGREPRHEPLERLERAAGERIALKRIGQEFGLS